MQFLLPAPEAYAQLCVAGVDRRGGGREMAEGIGKKSPRQEHWEDFHENEEQPKKKNKNKTKSIKYFSDFQLAKQAVFQSAPVEGLPQNQANAYSQERIKLYPLLIFYSSYGPVYYFSYPEYSRILLSEGLHKTPHFLLTDFSLSVLSCRCGLP